MEYEIIISRQAVKEIKKLPKAAVPKVYSKIRSLSDNPRPNGVVKLVTYDNLWRVRVGPYRIIYSIEDKIKVVDVRKVVNRKDAY
ncbi:MAG TPA: type II toxin-antitoxin system RelE/ParE family toxin [Saprospiraceae bacterium]|nr:type II toxin-antitoxin system RelE/ParE family toxin [Saprospiraceae bacterium]